MIHDNCIHAEHHRTYVKFVDLIYIKKFFRQLTTYLKHCFVCQLYQIKKHKFYEKLMSISTTSLSYDIIIINFVIEFSIQFYEFDAMMFIIDKCIKKKYFDFKKINLHNQKMNKVFFQRFANKRLKHVKSNYFR